MKRKKKKELKKIAVKEIKNKLEEMKKFDEFQRLVKIIHELTDFYEDEFRHRLKEIADYFLIEEAAKSLYTLDAINSPNPIGFAQRYLLRKIREILRDEENG